MATAVDCLGGIDVMMDNAGLGGSAKLVDMADEQWSAVIGVTLDGAMRCTRAALRRMIEQGTGGAIVNNASVVGWRAQEEQSHYAVAPSLAMYPFLASDLSSYMTGEIVSVSSQRA